MIKKSLFVILSFTFFLALFSSCNSGKINGNIRINSLQTSGNDIIIKLEVENVGTKKHDFPIGCSLQRRDGSWYDFSYQIKSLRKEEKQEVVFKKNVSNLREFVLVRVAIWEKALSNGMLENRYDIDERSID